MNKLETEILPALNKYERDIDLCERQYRKKEAPITELEGKLVAPLKSLDEQMHLWIAGVNAQRVVVNALFNEDTPPMPFSHDNAEVQKTEDKPTVSKNADDSIVDMLRSNREWVSKMKKELSEIVDEEEAYIAELASKLIR